MYMYTNDLFLLLQVDIYSFGIVLFQLVTDGHSPFEELLPHEKDKAVEEVN